MTGMAFVASIGFTVAFLVGEVASVLIVYLGKNVFTVSDHHPPESWR